MRIDNVKVENVVQQDKKAAAASSANALSSTSATNSANKSTTPTTSATSSADGPTAAAIEAPVQGQPSLQTVEDISNGYRYCSWLCSVMSRAATNLENLEKSVVREKSGKVEKVVRESQGKCVLPVVCYRDCDGHRISIAWLSSVECRWHECDVLPNEYTETYLANREQWFHFDLECVHACFPVHSRVHLGLSVYRRRYVVNIWKTRGKVREFDEDWKVATLFISLLLVG